jgi:glycosyltransferase involved in cell wall biosynthesis
VKVAIVYDCLYPHTIGGAERWYRNLAERLAAERHDVTYLTLRQWPRGERPALEGVEIVAVGPRMRLYVNGRRRILPPLVFGLGVLWHLLRRGRRYDVVHVASFPYFSLLAAAAARRLGRYQLGVDWIELWTRAYWKEYLGPVGGRIGWAVQKLCAHLGHRAFALSRLHADRLAGLGFKGEVTVLPGLYAGPVDLPSEPAPAEPVIVFAGRLIPEKRAPAVVHALMRAREREPTLQAEIYGDGPEGEAVRRAIAESGLEDAVRAPGFVQGAEVHNALRRALCLVLPSRREGFGLVVVEAASVGTPSVVVQDPDNAATELIDEGRNGFLAESAEPGDLADAILRVSDAGPELRRSTADWFRQNAERLSVESSLRIVLTAYGR